MFKIESYITPLLMGYVDKYVKLRPEDFQLSLWGGDAVLYNLDLRLDVIEKIFQLPIVFQSGHIHELRLHIPWTKLGYEPVVVTINTIECILKLRDTAYSDKHSSRAGSEARNKSTTPKQKIRRQEGDELPPGYLQSLMNKIVNNVSIIVNNLIIKFVEDDIVLSLNVKSAECYSVDKDWTRGFVELSAPDFVLRRVINFCDLTVCLDKRDASGKIEHYQDPVMYRCSVSSRLYSKYEGMNAKYPLETKWNVFCERFDLSFTDTQLPMFLRLIELILAIYYGTLEFQKPPTEDVTAPADMSFGKDRDTSVGEPPPEEMDESKQGWVSWAWSYVPQILPEEEDSGSQESGSKPPKRKPIPSVVSIGMYAYKTSVIFKVTEFIKEKAHYGPKKISFKPFMYMEAEGISLELLIQGLSFFDAQFGITNLRVFSQGVCICGAEDEEHARNNVLLSGGEPLTSKSTNNYIYQSLFDPQCPENLGIPKQQILDFEEHKQIYTEQYGLQKYGVFWLDSLYSMPSPEEEKSHSSRSSVSSVGEPANVFMKENALSRFVIGKCHLNVSSTTVHRVKKILDAAYKYEYESYSKKHEERVDENRPHPTEEQVKSLLDYIPTRTYHLTLLQPVISVLSAEHPYCDISKKVYRSQAFSKKITGAKGTQLYPLYGMQMSSQRFDLQGTSPMYPRKLVQLVSKIAGPPSNLLHHCHSHTQIKLFGFHVGLTKIDLEGCRSPMTTIMPPASGAMYIRRLLLPMYWNNMYLPKLEKVYELPQVSLSLTKGNLLVVLEIISSWQQTTPKPADITTNTLMDDVFPNQENDKGPKYPVLEMTMYGLELKTCRNDVVTACSGNLSAIQALVYKHDRGNFNAIPVVSGPSCTESLHSMDWILQKPSSIEDVTNELISFTYQLPRKLDQIQAPSAVLINVEGICCNLDPVLIDWLSYIPNNKVVKTGEPKVELNLELAKAASPLQGDISQMSQMSSGSKRPSVTLTRSPTMGQTSTQHTRRSESKDAGNQRVGIGEKLAKIFPVIRIVQVQVEVKNMAIFLPRESVNIPEPSVNIVKNYVSMANSKCLSDTLVVCLPHVVVQSAGLKTVPFLQEIPIMSMDGSLVGEKIPWNVTLRNCSMYTIHNTGVQTVRPIALAKPATVNCTVGVSYKYTPPTSDIISSLGLCLHTDMHPVEVSTSLEQVKLLFGISSQCLKFSTKLAFLMNDISSSFINKDAMKEEPKVPTQVTLNPQGQNQTLSATSVTEEAPYTQTSGDITSLDTTISRDMEILDSETEGVKLSLWLQWTLPKCEVSLYTKGKEGMKLSTVLEDMTMSVDVQDVYSKVKVNFGAISVKHYFRSSDNKWLKGPNEGILLTCRDELSHDSHIISSKLWSHDQHRPTTTQTGSSLYQHSQSRDLAHGCMNLTFTRALRKNVKKKFQKLNIEVPTIDEQNGNILNRFYFHKYVSEICVTMNPCDVVLCTSPLINLLTDLYALDMTKPAKQGSSVPPKVKKGDKSGVPRVTCSNHPLIYADFAAMRMFIPGKEFCKGPRQKNELRSTMSHDMILIQTQSVSIIPHADNPLPRYAVDKELYQQAVQLGVTSESGSALQDRQYQIDVKGISITTGCWVEFPRAESVVKKNLPTPTTQIPAVEWNTVKSLMSEDKDIQLIPILSPCDLKLIAAPAIVNTTPGWGSKMEENLVCGYSFEFNVVSDLDLHLSTNQIHLMKKVAMEMTDSFKEINGSSDNIHEDKESVPDSGLGSDLSMATEKVQKVTVANRTEKSSDDKFKLLTPIDILLTAGRISCTIYSHFTVEREVKIEKKKSENHHKAKRSGKMDLEWRVDTDTRNKIDDDDNELGLRTHLDFQDTYFMNMYDLQNQGQEAKVIPAGSLCIKPFLFLYLSQPHTVVSCHEDEQKFETSCYDVLAKCPQEGTLIQATEVKMLPDCSDFSLYILETRAGQPDHTTGVPPSLYTLTVTNFLTQPAGIVLKLERPVKSSLSFVKLNLFEDFLKVLFPGGRSTQSKGQSSTRSPKGTKTSETSSSLKRISFFSLQTEQIVVALETKPVDGTPGILFSFSNINFEGDIQLNANSDVTGINSSSYIRDIFMKVTFNDRQLPLIGPFSVKMDGSLSSFFLDEKYQMSQSIVTIATGLVPIHAGQEHVVCLKSFTEHVMELIQEIQKKTEDKSKSSRDVEENIIQKAEKKTQAIVHSSTDDLRSGGFQYVMESELMPRFGEIAFCTRDSEGNSSMTWTYSMPRVLSHVSSTPIPFNMIGPDGDKTVQCVLQHWEPLIQQFVDYVEVDLSDSLVTEVRLPDAKTAQSQDLVVAQTWRVLIRNLCREEVILPTSLAASMKINSCFIPELVPTHELGCTLERVELHLSNHIHCLGKETPSRLRPFFMSSCYPASGEFAVLTLDNILCAGTHVTGSQSRIQGQFNSSIRLDLLEFKTLTVQRVVSPFELSGVVLYRLNNKPNTLDVDISCEPVTVRMGQSITHTVYSSLLAWNHIFSDKTEGDEVIFGHYVICNDTQIPIRFGQVGTDENLILQPREMHQYGWRSHKLKQELHLCLDGKVWKWCEPFEIGKVGSYVRGVKSTDYQYTVIIRVTKLSNVQNQIVISGQLLVSNRLSQHLEVKVTTNSSDQEHRAVVGSEHTIPSYVLEPADIQGIKFRPWGSRGVWSKEVYVSGASARENNLVKITFSDQKSSFHIWCKVFTQTVDTVPQVFVVLCPLYTVRSHLPYTMYINIDTSKLDLHQQIEAPGRGHDLQLICAGGDIHHSLTFQLSPCAGKSSSSVTLSTGLIDQLSRSPMKELDYTCLQSYWKQENWFAWPYTADSKLGENIQRPEKQSLTSQELKLASQPTIDLNISLSELWPGCPTVLVDITPPCLVTNLSNLDLVIMGTEDMSYDIPKGQTLSPPRLEGSFHVGLTTEEGTFLSAPIPLSEEELNAQRYRNDVGKTLYVDAHVVVPIFLKQNRNSKVCFLTVTSNIKHDIQVISIRERFTLTNYTRHDLTVCPFVIPQLSGKISSPVEDNILLATHKGCHGDKSDLHPLTLLPLKFTNELQDQIDHTTSFVYYITIQNMSRKRTQSENEDSQEKACKSSEWSMPVRLSANEHGCKSTSCIHVPNMMGESECMSLCITGHEKQGVTYFVIEEDKAPTCHITNRCGFPLYFGQTLMNLSLSGTTLQEQTELVNELPVLQTEESTFYTPPHLNSLFPQMHDKQAIPRLHISAFPLNCDNKSDLLTLQWSQPIDLLLAADNFVNIPGVADVKVHVTQVAMVTYVSVEPITKADVSAKEIRSRLKGHDTTVVIETKDNGENKNEVDESHSDISNSKDVVQTKQEVLKKQRVPKQPLQMSLGILVNQFSLIIQDELTKPTAWGELIRFTVDDLFMATYPTSNLDTKMDHHRNCIVLSAGDVQLDNQNHKEGKYDFPVVLMRQNCDTNPYNTDNIPLAQMNILEKQAVLKSCSVFHLQILLGTIDNKSTVIESVEISSKPLSFYIDDSFIFRCIKEAEGFLPVPLTFNQLTPVSLLKLPSSVKRNARTISSPVLIGYLVLQPLDVMLSVHASLKLFIASDHSPLSFGKFEKRSLCTNAYQLTRAVVMHYASGALFRAGAVVGSLEILGNPTGLVRSIGTGVADFFRMPYRGLTRGPGAFVLGVSSGTSSMVKNITTGMLKSVTNFASSVSRNMDRLSLDGTHLERQEESRRHRPDGVGEGLKQGLTGLGISLLGAIAGLADQPIQSMVQTDNQSKTASLVTGMGKGLVGVFTKPVGGAAEFVSQTGQGILHGTGLSQYAQQRRSPVILEIRDSPCGQLKYALKLLPSLPSTDILCCMEAKFINLTDTLVPVTLILTPEVLFLIDHEEDSQQQSFSVIELECGVTVGDSPILNIVQRDSQTFHDQQLGPTNDERVTAFIDGASKFVGQQYTDNNNQNFYTEPVINKTQSKTGISTIDHILEHKTNDLVNMSDVSSQRTPLIGDQTSQGRYAGSGTKGEQISDSQSDSSASLVQANFATLPQYDFYMSATKLAAFLAIFNLTKNKLESVGFAV